ncbi:hypothetical protein TNCT_72601 [Trichonephila clavata]|uniref:Uncharacterized protein n=1 Tax=Trichonephila clavata TaxID=2740835 RepID=A0A8X6LN33_TRICU|nr:hypothetical protein TNCT_72601 [Trichonephila clavata]
MGRAERALIEDRLHKLMEAYAFFSPAPDVWPGDSSPSSPSISALCLDKESENRQKGGEKRQRNVKERDFSRA